MHNATPEQIEAFLNAGGETRVVIRKVERIAIDPIKQNALLQMQRNHWRKLHTTRMTPEQLKRWVSEIPGCSSCKQKFLKILLVIPPVFGDGWEHWTFTVHNVVNVDIGKQVFSWQAACKLYGWESR